MGRRDVTKKICANECGGGNGRRRRRFQKETEKDKKKNKKVLEIWTETEGRHKALDEKMKPKRHRIGEI